MIVGRQVIRVDERHVIDVAGHVREQVGDPRARLAMAGPAERRLEAAALVWKKPVRGSAPERV